MTVSIIDYGLGNLGSVSNMLRHIGAEVRLVSRPEEVASSERVLLPGVGAFDYGVARLRETGFTGPLNEFAASGRPLLGICLGMQLLATSSEEGIESGLGLIPGRSRRLVSDAGLRVPHMGWNSVTPRESDPLFAGIDELNRFYFVHSYHVVPDSDNHILATTNYGTDFVSAVRSGNVVGAQFHPEKSHLFGMTVLRNFARS